MHTRLLAPMALAAALLTGAMNLADTDSEGAKPLSCFDVTCAKLDTYTAAILARSASLGAARRYLVIGDSLTEAADLDAVCDAAPINAGIGGTTTRTWIDRAGPLADQIKPAFVVIALGTNDAYQNKIEGYGKRLDAVLEAVAAYPTIVIPPPASADPQLAERFAQFTAVAAGRENAAAPLETPVTTDGVHLTQQDYVAWNAALSSKAKTSICPTGRL